MLSKPYCHKWHNASIYKDIAQASRGNTTLQVTQRMNDGMRMIGAGKVSV